MLEHVACVVYIFSDNYWSHLFVKWMMLEYFSNIWQLLSYSDDN